VAGIVVGHGTDTMHHTAAALSFMLQDLPVPVVMVGSQRSSDRPSSDAAINLINATRTAATSDIAEVMVCMFGPTSDEYGLLHRGTRVRKMHSSYRSTFRTLSDIPLGKVDLTGVTPYRDDYRRRRTERKVDLKAVFDDRVSLVYYYPNMKPDIIDSLIAAGYKGIVIAGTGLGHVNKPLYPALDRARSAGVHVYMTVQTMWGYVQMYVYETGRELMGLGVIPAANMLPEVAYVKLGWALGQSQDHAEVRRLMLTPVNGEITDREPHDGYLVLQGGSPEVAAFISSHWK
jgi:glutamyl-tRNA(Gln) amidotransferase subunit D